MSLPLEYWDPTQIAPIPLLQELNDWVIKRNERRLPKWKFRFASDLAAQIQPKLTRAHAILFEGAALRTENVSVKLFTEPKLLHDGRQYWRMKFILSRSEQDTVWRFKPKSAGWGRGSPKDGVIELRQRMITALHPDRFARLTPDLMLSPHCLCCGKGLTDPASMARWIGPECWGNASTNLPQMFRAEELFTAIESMRGAA
jgi:hypothetical protein